MSLWNKFKPIKDTISPRTRIQTIQIASKETSFCACLKASLTLEAAVVIPVMMGVFVSLLFFFRMMQVQALIEDALMYAGRKVAVESSIVTSDETLFLSAEVFMVAALKDEEIIERYVKNGIWGITLLGSSGDEETLCLKANYCIKLPISLFGIHEIWLWNQDIFHKWVGSQNSLEKEEEGWVYVTTNGAVYHSSLHCRVLNLSVKKVSVEKVKEIRGASGQEYVACYRCAEGRSDLEMVYCADYGTLYHGSLDCAFIKRTIRKISISDVANKRPCSFCYGEETSCLE